MKDEIKEILDNLKDYWKTAIDNKIILCNRKEMIQLLDYITNLQTIEQQYSSLLSENAELENKITNLQEEIKSANESITWWQNRFNALQEKNQRLLVQLNENQQYYLHYISCLFVLTQFKKQELYLTKY